MGEIITAVYEHGILRPLTPMTLPEHTRLQLQIVSKLSPAKEERQQVHQALLDAGLIRPSPAVEQVEPVSEPELIDAARSLAAAGPISDLIIMERDDR